MAGGWGWGRRRGPVSAPHAQQPANRWQRAGRAIGTPGWSCAPPPTVVDKGWQTAAELAATRQSEPRNCCVWPLSPSSAGGLPAFADHHGGWCTRPSGRSGCSPCALPTSGRLLCVWGADWSVPSAPPAGQRTPRRRLRAVFPSPQTAVVGVAPRRLKLTITLPASNRRAAGCCAFSSLVWPADGPADRRGTDDRGVS